MSAPPIPPDHTTPEWLNAYCGNQLLGTSIAFMVLGPTFVGLRWYTRLSTEAKPGWDDYLILPALVANFALQIADILLITNGNVGWHVEHFILADPNPNFIFEWAKILFTVEITYILAVCLGKLAILLIYARVFTSKPMLYTTYSLMGIVVAAWFGSSIADILQSLPVGCQWDPNAVENCHSFDILAYFRYLSLPSIITDIVMLVLPIPMIWRLKISRSKKIGLAGVFLTGSIGLIASCVRFAIFFQADALEDPTWKSAFLNVWTVTEPGTYLIAACLPALRPIFLAALRKVGLSSTKDRASNYAYGGGPGGGAFRKPQQFGNGRRMSNLDSKRVKGAHDSILEMGLGRGGFEPIPEDTSMSLGTGDDKSLLSREGKGLSVLETGRRPGPGQDIQAGIEVRRDIDVVFSERNEPSAYELQSAGFGRGTAK